METKLTIDNEQGTESLTFEFSSHLSASQVRSYKAGLVQDGVEEKRITISGTDSSWKAIADEVLGYLRDRGHCIGPVVMPPDGNGLRRIIDGKFCTIKDILDLAAREG